VLNDAFLNILCGFVLRLESGLEAQSTAFINICAFKNGCSGSQESWLNLRRISMCYHYSNQNPLDVVNLQFVDSALH
jgi:hypothetical protein